MPTPLIKATAQKAHRSVQRIEGYWDAAKKSALKKFKKNDPGYWAYVNAIIQRRSGLREGFTFKDFLLNEREHQELNIADSEFYKAGAAGAGCIILANDTGEICIPYRSDKVEQPYTWGTWGGSIDPGETPIEAVKRELKEEAGYTGDLELTPLYLFKHPSGFTYHNFLAIVKNKFVPKLNWETDEVKWVRMDDVPTPLHFGLRELLEDPSSLKKIQDEIAKCGAH